VVRFSLSEKPSDRTIKPGGNEISVLATEFDAMKSRLANDMELRVQSEAKMQAILVSAPDGIITVNEQGIIDTVNPAAAEMFGYDPAELVGQHWRLLVADPTRDFSGKSVDITGEDRETRAQRLENENAGLRKDGSTFPMHVTASTVEFGARRIVLGIFRDITELNRMQERVLRSEHLAAIGEMGASVAHEIRNPIAGISGAIQVLRDTLTPDDKRREVIQEIMSQVTRVDQTLRELLMIAKPWSPELAPCSVEAVLIRAIERVKTQDAFRGVVFELDANDTAYANLDEFLIEQVLWNLFRNAAQAMPNGGTIQCSVTDTLQSVRIAVQDSGEGIPPDVVDKVFRPFFTTKTRGTGLGLPVARQIVEAHGGAIAIDSTPGKGTRITLDLPKGKLAWQVAS
jgi:PAS domain S-box-containing protein